MKFIKMIASWQVIMAIQLLVSILLAFTTFKLNVLPFRYALILFIVLLLLLVGMFFFTKSKKQVVDGKVAIRPIVGKIISILLSIVMLIASSMLMKTEGAIAKITGNDTQTTVISLMTLKDSKFNSADDLKASTPVGVNTIADKTNIDKGLKALKDEAKFTKKDYSTFKSLSDDLYNGKVKAILVDNAYQSVLEHIMKIGHRKQKQSGNMKLRKRLKILQQMQRLRRNHSHYLFLVWIVVVM